MTIGIIGFGNMGKAIAEKLKTKYQIWVFDRDAGKTKAIEGVNVAQSNIDLTEKTEAIILAVKPQEFEYLLEEIKQHVKGKLIISIAAGISTRYIEKFLGEARVVRAMPNIAAKIGKSATCVTKGNYAEEQDLDFAKELFDCLGKTWVIEEKLINAATAISGSGPAYIYFHMELNRYDAKNLPKLVEKYYVERLAKAAEAVGFDHQTAQDLAKETTASSLSLSAETGIEPAELRKQITSAGGTTEAAIDRLAKSGSWEEAAQAAMKRAEQLAKE